jgi:hypothetical protein
MPKVTLKKAQFSTLFSKDIKQRILADFESTPGKRTVLTREFDTALQKAADTFVNDTVPSVEKVAKDHYRDSFDLVSNTLKSGLRLVGSINAGDGQVPYSFREFVPAYKAHKAIVKPGTQFLFWKFQGHLSKNFRQFTSVRKGSISRTKSVSTVQSRGYKYQGRLYRYQVEVAFPEIKTNQYLDAIFREAYTLADASVAPYLPQGLNFEGGTQGNAMDILTLLESGGHKWSRPFMTELMAKRGASVRKLMLNTINNQWKSLTLK